MKTKFVKAVAAFTFAGWTGILTAQTIVIPQVQPTPIVRPQIVVPQVQPTPIVVPQIVRDPIRPTPIPATPIYIPPIQRPAISIPAVTPTPVLQLPSPGNPVPTQTTLPTNSDANPRGTSFFSLPPGIFSTGSPYSSEDWETVVFGPYRLSSPY